jgi:hypothetical protein
MRSILGRATSIFFDFELKAATGWLIHIPTVIGAVVVSCNLRGVTKVLQLASADVATFLKTGGASRPIRIKAAMRITALPW